MTHFERFTSEEVQAEKEARFRGRIALVFEWNEARVISRKEAKALKLRDWAPKAPFAIVTGENEFLVVSPFDDEREDYIIPQISESLFDINKILDLEGSAVQLSRETPQQVHRKVLTYEKLTLSPPVALKNLKNLPDFDELVAAVKHGKVFSVQYERGKWAEISAYVPEIDAERVTTLSPAAFERGNFWKNLEKFNSTHAVYNGGETGPTEPHSFAFIIRPTWGTSTSS